MNPRSGEDFDHPWLIQRIPEEVLALYRKAMFRVRSSNEPLMILDALADMQEILQEVERAAVAEAREQGATWSQVAEAPVSMLPRGTGPASRRAGSPRLRFAGVT